MDKQTTQPELTEYVDLGKELQRIAWLELDGVRYVNAGFTGNVEQLDVVQLGGALQ